MNDRTNADLLQRDHDYLIHSLHDPQTHLDGIVWVKGDGWTLTDADGKEYIDGLSGLWNVILGHGRMEIVEAAAKQMAELAYCSGYSGSTNRRALELGERLAGLTYPSINRFFFTSGGGEATDSTIKTARYYWKAVGRPDKVKIICIDGAYHGVTLAAMCATGMPAYWTMFEPRMPNFVHIPNHDRYRYEVAADKDPESAAADELEKAILAEGPETVALFLMEPVMGAGAYVPPAGYFKRVREICDTYEVLLAVDEVITGFGRTGEIFALKHWGVEPDLMQFAKGISSGYVPLGGIGVSDRISEVFERDESPVWMHCYTYSGHPVACAAALATIDLIERDDVVANAGRTGARLRARLERQLGQHPNVGDIRGLGQISAIEIVEDRDTKALFAPERKIGPKIVAACRARGLFTRGRGDQVYLGPPLILDDETTDRIADILSEAVEEVLREI